MRIVCLLAVLIAITSSTKINCSYEISTFFVIGPTYYCKIPSKLNITSPELAIIDSTSDNHNFNNGNDDVYGFWADNKTINFFPQNLDKIFRNLKLIVIMHGKISELRQMDLKSFPQLEYLNLHNNSIEVLDEGLFDFNPNLGFINFANNKLYRIYPYIFDSLSSLKLLFLDGNLCVDKLAKDDHKALMAVKKEVKMKCLNGTFTTTTTSTTTEVIKVGWDMDGQDRNFGKNLMVDGFILLTAVVLNVLQ